MFKELQLGKKYDLEKHDVKSAFFDIELEKDTEDSFMYIATNSMRLNGANVVFYDSLLKTFSELIKSDFYIIPSSIHEVMLVPNSSLELKELKEMVYSINRTALMEEEFLSDNVYYYNVNTDSIKIVL